MDPQTEKSFFDTRTLIAIVLVGVVFFGWQKYLEKKYPNLNQRQSQQTAETLEPGKATITAEGSTDGSSQTAPGETLSSAQGNVQSAEPVRFEEQTINFSYPGVSFQVSSAGMAIRSWKTERYKTRDFEPVELGFSRAFGAFELRPLVSGGKPTPEPLYFQIEKVAPNRVEGTAFWNLTSGQVLSAGQGVVEIKRVLEFNPEDFSFKHQVFVKGPLGPQTASGQSLSGLLVFIPEQFRRPENTSFLLPSFDYQEFIVRSQGSMERVYPDEKKRVKQSFDSVSLAGISSQYFTVLSLDRSPIIPKVEVEQTSLGELLVLKSYEFPLGLREVELSFTSYMGPKSLSYLQKVDSSLNEVINFGIFGSIARLLLGMMTWFHGFVGNWGWSIILLTLVVRLAVLPFNLISYRSMKKMAALQPVLQSIRERYKDDPQAINRETMAALKKSGANPVGGCLPILLQMPIFFALYQALGQSIELYQAPFVFWISDLSLKDPFYVLPILMGLTLFIQQKITPTTLDPTQAKILMWLPVIFTVFTLGLPSGLTLYIFVSTLFGVIQQKIFMLDKGKASATESSNQKESDQNKNLKQKKAIQDSADNLSV